MNDNTIQSEARVFATLELTAYSTLGAEPTADSSAAQADQDANAPPLTAFCENGAEPAERLCRNTKDRGRFSIHIGNAWRPRGSGHRRSRVQVRIHYDNGRQQTSEVLVLTSLSYKPHRFILSDVDASSPPDRFPLRPR